MINKELVKAVAKRIDDLVDWKEITGNVILGTVLELADDIGLPYGLGIVNERWGDKIPPELVPHVEKALQCFVDGDYFGMIEAVPDGLNDIIDIKWFDDDFEAVFIATNFNALFKIAYYYASKNVDLEELEEPDID